jgi:hypothetical protein
MGFESSNVIEINVASQHYPTHAHLDATVASSLDRLAATESPVCVDTKR